MFLLLGILLSFNVFGQVQKDTTKNTIKKTIIKQDFATVYCKIQLDYVGGLKAMQGKIPRVIFYIDFGIKNNDHGFFDSLKDENGNEIHFWTNMEGINYMSSLGWELVQCYIIPTTSAKGLAIMEGGGDVRFIMKKKINRNEK